MGSCCALDTCLDRSAPYSDNICCDLPGYVQTPTPSVIPPVVATECCPESRANRSVGGSGYNSCCAYGSVAALDANTQVWGCCNGTAVRVDPNDESAGSICCADYTYSSCPTASGYVCCMAERCTTDQGGACCVGERCPNVLTGFCCPNGADSGATGCYVDAVSLEYDCCAPTKRCDTDGDSGTEGGTCCESTETCRQIQSDTTYKCCADADICGTTTCCAEGLGCIDGICQACTQNSQCPSSAPYCNVGTHICRTEPCFTDADCYHTSIATLPQILTSV